MSLHPSVAAVRVAVRRTLAELVAEQPGGELPPDAAVLVACSGGAGLAGAALGDGLRGAQARPAGHRRDRRPRPPGGVRRARRARGRADGRLGADETATARVKVQGGGRGPEAAAREARYAVLDQMVQHFGAVGVLLGHTLDDQAETVLLGPGPRLRRPVAGRDAARLRPLPPAAARRDPHRHRHRLPGRGDRVLERPAQHRPGVRPGPRAPQGAAGARGRARPGRGRRAGPHRRPAPRRHGAARPARRRRPTTSSRDADDDGLEVKALADLPPATRHRVLRLAALDAGATASELFHVHVLALAQLWSSRGSGGEVQLPGHVTAYLSSGGPRTGGCGSAPPLCKADRHGRCRRRVRPRRGALHRGPDPGAARASWPARSRPTTTARTC